ncbi:MAG: Gfo/Idh/MocA family oxidoreductase, partial [Micromonosporaceae bacterium]|nr:Gfo/Idh/MocA family oxidoreductase [Micromonosporaceae bacterium]
ADALAGWVAAQTGQAPPARYDTLAAALDGQARSGGTGLQMVAVCTPTGLHGEVAEQAIAAGLHVVIEKPLEVSMPRARSVAGLAADAARRGQVCSVISQHRFDPACAAVAGAVAAGRFGRLTSGVADLAWWRPQSYYDSAAWRGTWELDGGGAVMNQGIHIVDLLLWLFGTPVEVYAHTARLAHQRVPIEDVAVATVRFDSGALAVLHASTAAYPGGAMRLGVHGDRGSAIIHDGRLEYFHAAAAAGPDNPRDAANQAAAQVPAGELRGAGPAPDGVVLGHLRQYQDVVAAIEDGRSPAVGTAEGLLALAVVCAVYASATVGRPVAVAEVLDGGYDAVTVATEVARR